MRFLICAVVLLVASGLPTTAWLTPDALAAERTKIYNDRNRQVGDVYDPGHGRRLQIRDNRRRIIGYIERDGDITDSRRRKIGKIEELLDGD